MSKSSSALGQVDDRLSHVAAVIVNWNDADTSIRCLISIRAASPEVMLILVDNGSDQDPWPAIDQHVPGTVLVRLARNRGYAAAVNAGAREALARGAQNLLFLNNDTIVEKGALAALLDAAERHPGCILGPKIVYAERPDLIWSAGGSLLGSMCTTRHLGEGEPASSYMVERRVEWATNCALFVSSQVFARVGLMDEKYFIYLDDVDWCLRAAAKGVQTWFVPDAIILHDVSLVMRSRKLPVRYYSYRNHYRLALRHSAYWVRPLVIADALWTLGKAGMRSATMPAYRKDRYYHARTRGVLDFLSGRSGPMSAPDVAVAMPPAATAD